MCLGIPGQVIDVKDPDDPLARRGTVDFKGNHVDVSLAMVPEASVGSWVLVHAGYALEQLDENEAIETWQWLQQAQIVDVGDLPEPLQKTAGERAAAADEP